MSAPLEGKVALVAGATRGAGRGTAVALGEAGATVYCTGRSTREQRSEYDRPETIEETAELVDAAGGTGIAVRVDHLVPAEVEALVRRIDGEQGRLDVLVNDIWGAEQLFEWDKPLWEHDLDRGLRTLRLAIDTHLITSHFALSLADPGAGRARRRDDRRHARVQRRELPRVRLLRPRQVVGAAARVRAGPGARCARLHRRGAHARLAALGDDARDLRRDRGQLARRRRGQPALRRDLGEPALRGPSRGGARRRSRSCTSATAARSRRAGSHASTASPTSTAPSRTAGATWSRCRTRGCRPTPAATADEPAGNAGGQTSASSRTCVRRKWLPDGSRKEESIP